jgi:hypothetical protein
VSSKDYAPGISFAITWLHERAKEMRDPHATQILNSAAFSLGNAKARGGYVLNDELSRIRTEIDGLRASRPSGNDNE